VNGPLRLESSWPHEPPDPRVVVLAGHDDSIATCRFSFAGDQLVSGDRSGRLLVRDVPSGAVRADLRLASTTGHLRPGVTACATGPGDLTAVGLVDGTVHLLRAAKLVRTFPSEGWSDPVTALVFAADGDWLLIRDAGASRVRVHTTGSGARLIDVPCDPWAPLCLLDRRLAVGNRRGLVVRDLDRPERPTALSGHGDEVIAFARLGGLFVSTDSSGEVRTWDAATGRCAAVFVGVTGPAAVDPDTDRLVLPTRDGVRICDPRRGDPRGEVRRHRVRAATRRRTASTLTRLAERLPALADRADALALPDLATSCLVGLGRSVVATVRAEEELDGEIIRTAHVLAFHDPSDGYRREVLRLPGRCAGAVPIPGTDRVATVDDAGGLSVWDRSGTERFALDTAVDGEVTAIALHLSAAWLAIADSAGQVHLVDPHADGAARPADPLAEPMIACAVSPEGRWMATATPGRTVVVWEPGAGEVSHVFPGHFAPTWADRFVPVRVVAPAEGWLAYRDGGGRIRVRDPRSGERLAVVPTEGSELAAAAHADWFATAERDGRVRLWRPDGTLLQVLDGHPGPVSGTATTPDGALLATACAAAVRLWDTADGQAGPSIAIDPTGLGATRRLVLGPNLLVLAGDGPEICLRDIGGRDVRTWTAPSPITALAADPGTTVLLTGHADGSATAWSPGTDTSTALDARHSGAVTACAVDPSGALAATAGDDGELLVSDLQTGAVVATAGSGGPVADCRWTPTGAVLVAGRAGVHLFRPSSAGRASPAEA